MPLKIEVNQGEKVSVNMNSGTLSCIDLLVDNGFYSNRSDFINQAVRELIRNHQSTIDRIVDSKIAENKPKVLGRSKNIGIATARIVEGTEDDVCEENSWFFGLSGLSPQELAELSMERKRVNLTGYGVLAIDENCPEELLFEVIKSIKVRGKVICTEAVREHYELKK